MNVVEASILAAVTTLVGLIIVALWKAGGKLLAALKQIGKLPDAVGELVTELRHAIAELRALAARVEKLEAYLPDSLRFTADVTLSNEGV